MLHSDRGVAPMMLFFGRADSSVGWQEKVDYIAAAQRYFAGGAFFWDERLHEGTQTASWLPMQTTRQLYRWRLDRSFAAFSNASADGVLGNGDPAIGDSVGTVAGYLEGDTTCVEDAAQWSATLSTRALSTRWQTFPAPESVTVDVTPRRLQQFHPLPDKPLDWTNICICDGSLIQSGTVRAEHDGRVTIPGVKVLRGGVRLTIGASMAAITSQAPTPRLALAILGAPMRSQAVVSVDWRPRLPATLQMFDIGGRLVRTLESGSPAGTTTYGIRRDGLAAGVYLLRARQAGATVSRRLLVLR
jgi:hypothetical protein